MADLLEQLKAALADRYAIDRELGSGGMATVYLARDLKHERQVAVKVLRPELAAALGADRFNQEIKIAAQLTHPNILTLIDSGDADGLLYYVMPYVEGQSLRDKLAHGGELPIGDAVRILRDVVDALSEAHEHGVVHRDIKPDNILLTKHHALVTDFGVAKAVSEATGRQQLTTEGVALGTPTYMSPEQASADPHIDHRADIYSVGAVAYELLTGRPPFLGTTAQMILSAHITDTPEPVTKYRESVPPALEQLVTKCLEKKAADRWQTAEELLPQLEALATPSGGVTPVVTVPLSAVARRKKTAVLASVFAVVIAVVVVVMLISRGSGVTLDAHRVAVTPFENLTGEDSLDLHGQVAASWITDGLQQVDVLSVVPWMAVQQEASALGGGNSVRELADITGAGIVVSGSFSRHGDSLRFRAEITDPRRMEVLHTVPPVSGLLMNPEVAFDELGERITGALAVMLDTVLGELVSLSLQRPTVSAYRESVRGGDLYSQGRFDEAIEHLTTAYELDTTFISPLLYAASAQLNLGRHADADSLIGIAERFRDRLSRRERLTLSWLTARQQGDRTERLRAARGLAESHPIWMYQSGYEAILANRPQEAVEALERIDPSRGWMKEWVSYWGQLTAARHMLGDHRRESRDAQRGREQHPDRLLVFNYEARALAALGRVDEATLLFDEILGLPPDPSWGHAEPMVFAGLCLRAHGYTEAAQEVLQLALDRLSSFSPDESQSRDHRYNLGQTLYWSERWDETREVLLQLVIENPDNVEYAGHLGVAHARLGNVDEASRISDELAALDRPYLLGSNTLWRARIAAVLGDRGQAVELLRQAFAEGINYGPRLHTDIDLESLRDYPPFQELMRPKG